MRFTCPEDLKSSVFTNQINYTLIYELLSLLNCKFIVQCCHFIIHLHKPILYLYPIKGWPDMCGGPRQANNLVSLKTHVF